MKIFFRSQNLITHLGILLALTFSSSLMASAEQVVLSPPQPLVKNFHPSFKVLPYLVKNGRGENLLKFQLGKEEKLIINIYKENTADQQKELSKTISEKFLTNKFYTLSLGPQFCDEKMIYDIQTMSDQGNRTLVQRSSVESFSCDSREEIIFGLISDTQNLINHHPLLAKVAAGKKDQIKMSFVLHGGDLVQTGGRESEWLNFNHVGHSYQSYLPLMAATGNHEYWFSQTVNKLPAFFQTYARWDEDTLGEVEYQFPQFNLLLFNSNIDKLSAIDQEWQWNWLKGALNKAKSENKKVIVVYHHPPISSGNGSSSGLGPKMRERMVPMLEEAGNVLMVINGHEHIYERSLKDNIYYIVAGPAGGFRGTIRSKNPYSQYINNKVSTFSIFKISDQSLKMQTFDEKDQIIDQLDFLF